MPTEIVTAQDGDWTDPTTWVGGVVPAWSLPVRLLHCANLTTKLTVPMGGKIIIDGGCICTTQSVVVGMGGILIGITGGIYFNVADDRAFVGNATPGPDPMDPDDHSDTDVGLWGMMGSTVTINGPAVTPWLNAVPASGAGFVPLGYGCAAQRSIANGIVALAAAPIGWQQGDTLLLVAVNGTYQVATLTSVTGALIGFTGADAFTAPVITNGSAAIAPIVANLSRRFVIASDHVVEGDPNHRAHVALMGAGVYQVQNVELRDLGPRARLGRYPLHFHKLGSAGAAALATGNSIWQTTSDYGSRAVAIHATNGATVSNNVSLKVVGHAFFMEDGTELNNTVTGNLSVAVGQPNAPPNAVTGAGGAREELLVTGGLDLNGAPTTVVANQVSVPFWLREGNTISGNVAVGGTAPYGHAVLPSLARDTAGKLIPITGPVTLTACEARGLTGYAFWHGVSKFVLNSPVSAYVSISATHDPFGFWPPLQPGAPVGYTINDPVFLLNGAGSKDYGSQLFLNHTRGMVVTGGVLAGKIAVDTHYTSDFTVTGTRIVCDFLMNPTYWQTYLQPSGQPAQSSFTQCDITLTQTTPIAGYLFQGAYPLLAGQTTATLTISGCTGQIAIRDAKGKVTGTLDVNGRFTHAKNTAAGPGVPELNGALRLN